MPYDRQSMGESDLSAPPGCHRRANGQSLAEYALIVALIVKLSTDRSTFEVVAAG